MCELSLPFLKALAEPALPSVGGGQCGPCEPMSSTCPIQTYTHIESEKTQSLHYVFPKYQETWICELRWNFPSRHTVITTIFQHVIFHVSSISCQYVWIASIGLNELPDVGHTFKSTYVRCLAWSNARNFTSRHLFLYGIETKRVVSWVALQGLRKVYDDLNIKRKINLIWIKCLPKVWCSQCITCNVNGDPGNLVKYIQHLKWHSDNSITWTYNACDFPSLYDVVILAHHSTFHINKLRFVINLECQWLS